MSHLIHLPGVVLGDSPTYLLDIIDLSVNLPFDTSSNDLSVVFSVRRKRRTEKLNVTCTKLVGMTLDDGSINDQAPYNVAGVGGRCMAACPASVFPSVGEYEAEIRVVNAQNGAVSTAFQIFAISVRHPF